MVASQVPSARGAGSVGAVEIISARNWNQSFLRLLPNKGWRSYRVDKTMAAVR
jgi:hypothetical protein